MTGRGEGMRLNQYIASCGICSRREADRLIEEVRVYVDGIPAIPGMRVTGQERIEVNGKLIRGNLYGTGSPCRADHPGRL